MRRGWMIDREGMGQEKGVDGGEKGRGKGGRFWEKWE